MTAAVRACENWRPAWLMPRQVQLVKHHIIMRMTHYAMNMLLAACQLLVKRICWDLLSLPAWRKLVCPALLGSCIHEGTGAVQV